ncbi:MerR family transcriptional regulator [Bacillus sp. EAC]|uniref:MerR family transcriptional regulator n=1 Tax=Bacillus sp. EAC TaxID=1978338 RepID=UPI000B453AD3|nr:MerR family transcriptional regulator [Bacillus sp. EAC]
MLTTSQVAEQLQLTNKKVLYYSKKENFTLEKSSTGSYLFTEEQINQIKKAHESTLQTNDSNQLDREYILQIEQLIKNVTNLEAKMETKANEVVSVQVLEHRREIEDLKKFVVKLEDEIILLNETVKSLKSELDDQKKIVAFKPKKRFAILSIFGV